MHQIKRAAMTLLAVVYLKVAEIWNNIKKEQVSKDGSISNNNNTV